MRRDDGRVLAVRRPDEPGEELPGLWGLPATTLREDEPPEAGLRRLGQEKLGVSLTPVRVLGRGTQERPTYTLHMTVYEVRASGEPRLPPRHAGASGTLYDALDWLPAAAFREAAERGSLCCQVFLDAAETERAG